MAKGLASLQRLLHDQVILGPGVGVAAVEGGKESVRLLPRRWHVHRCRHEASSLVRPTGRRLEGCRHAVLHQQAPAGAVDAPHVAAGLEVQVAGGRPRQDPESQLGEDLGNDIEEACLPACVDTAADSDQGAVVAAPPECAMRRGTGALQFPGQHGLASAISQQRVQTLERSHHSSELTQGTLTLLGLRIPD